MRIIAILVNALLLPCAHSFLQPIPTRQTSTTSRYSAVSSDIPSSNSESVEFPPPLSPVERLKRGATFWSTAVPIIASYYGLISRIKLQELILDNPMTQEEIESLWDAQHQDGAKKLAETITQLKGFYVKTAQIISSRQGTSLCCRFLRFVLVTH
jgi:aarF domain-containing kinase